MWCVFKGKPGVFEAMGSAGAKSCRWIGVQPERSKQQSQESEKSKEPKESPGTPANWNGAQTKTCEEYMIHTSGWKLDAIRMWLLLLFLGMACGCKVM